MSDWNQHLAHAKHNFKFLESFHNKNNEAKDWALTVGFYGSVHLVEACIAKVSTFDFCGESITIKHSDQLSPKIKKTLITPPNGNLSPHRLRSKILQGAPIFNSMGDHYDLLLKQCHNARYKQYQWEFQQINLLFKTSLKPLMTEANKILNTKISSSFIGK